MEKRCPHTCGHCNDGDEGTYEESNYESEEYESSGDYSSDDETEEVEKDYTLFYLEGLRGRGEAIRLLFHHAGVPFNDVRLNQTQWTQELKNSGF